MTKQAAWWAPINARVNSVGESPLLCREPTSVEGLAVGEEGELEEQRAQKVRSADDAGHLETDERRRIRGGSHGATLAAVP